MGIQARLSATDSRLYTPDRDLAYCTQHLVHSAICALDEDKQDEWLKSFAEKYDISQDDLGFTAVALAEYFNKTLKDPSYKQPLDALTAAKFFEATHEAQHLACASIGRVLICAAFTAVRDVTKDPSEPSICSKEIADAANECFHKKYTFFERLARACNELKLAIVGLWSN